MLPCRRSLPCFWHPPSLSATVSPRPHPRSPRCSCTLSYAMNIRQLDFHHISQQQAELECSLPSMVAAIYRLLAHQSTSPRIAPSIELPGTGATLKLLEMARRIIPQECVLA